MKSNIIKRIISMILIVVMSISISATATENIDNSSLKFIPYEIIITKIDFQIISYDAAGNVFVFCTEKQDIYTYTYNKLGLPLTMNGGGVNTQYTYDNLGRIIREDLTTGISKLYNYDNCIKRRA